MARFTVRVELHDAESEEYEVLHAAMEARGFSRFIADTNGILYHLPWAEYNRDAQLTRKAILKSARQAADQTGKKYCVLVTQSAGRTWHNLLPA